MVAVVTDYCSVREVTLPGVCISYFLYKTTLLEDMLDCVSVVFHGYKYTSSSCVLCVYCGL